MSERTNNLEHEAAFCHSIETYRRSLWATILGLRPILDGDSWCVLWGEDLQNGIAAFGDSPEEAMLAFDAAMREKAPEKVK